MIVKEAVAPRKTGCVSRFTFKVNGLHKIPGSLNNLLGSEKNVNGTISDFVVRIFLTWFRVLSVDFGWQNGTGRHCCAG